jgi:hypothetical protein
MATRALAAALLAACTGACATEQHTTFVSAAPAPVRPAEVVTSAQLSAEASAACDSYGLVRGTPTHDRCIRDEFAARRPG